MLRRKQPMSLMKRMSHATWRLLAHSIYQGFLAQVSIIEAKHLLCKLCHVYNQDLEMTQFWILFGLLTVAFLFLNNIIGSILLRAPGKSTKKMPKYTRSGRVYGYF